MRTLRFGNNSIKIVKQEQGFTLVELLTVISVIATLAAMLFPAFESALESGRSASCLNNVKQLASGFMLYTDDNGNRLPNSTDGTTGAGQLGGWMYFSKYPANDTTESRNSFNPQQGSLFHYVNSMNVYICPSDMQGKQSGNSYSANSYLFGSYDSEGKFTASKSTSGFAQGRSLSDFYQASKWVMLGEEASSSESGSSASYIRTNSTDDGYLYVGYNTVSTRHKGGSNYAFLDGHAKWYNPAEVVSKNYLTGGVEISTSDTQ
ncbi:MAG: prepilin-type N-terminal cleavage/methylation domain-containing protein [Armatimonadota bacterium]|nr:prepilin-type N-terminal cleavage/methylation domain-containing protein [bacterium]